MRIKPISTLKIMLVLLLLSLSSYAGAEQRPGEMNTTSEPEETNSLRCETMYSQVTYNVYEGLFIKHQVSGEKIKIGDSGDAPLVCTNDEKWLIYYDKGSYRFDKKIAGLELVDLWRLELNSKRREKFATADFNDILILGKNILAPIGTKFFIGNRLGNPIQTEKPKWEIVGSSGNWRDSNTVWLKDGSALISSTWDADLKSDVLLVEQFTPEQKIFRIDLDIDNFLITNAYKGNRLKLKVWDDDSVTAKGTIDCTLDIEHEKATCETIKEYDRPSQFPSEFDRLIYLENEAQLKRFTPYVKEDDRTLYLRLKSGGYMKLKTTYDCVGWSSCSIYKLLDYYMDKGFYALELFFGEGTENMLISDKTGERFYVKSDPIISLDRNYFITVSGDWDFGTGGIFVWRFEDDKIIPELPLDLRDNNDDYIFIKWKNKKSALLHKVYSADYEHCPKVRTMTMPVTLKKKDNKWKLINDPSGIICKNLVPGTPASNELKQEKDFGRYFKNKNHVLSLRLKSRAYKKLSGPEDCDKRNHCAPFYFVDYFKDIGFYLVCNGDYRCEDYLLISDKTGKEYRAHKRFIFSPDKSIFLFDGSSSSFNKNDIVIWRVKGDELIEIPLKSSDAVFSDGDFRFLNWTDNSTMLISIFINADKNLCPDSMYMEFPATLKVSKDGWSITEDRSPKSVKCEPM